MVSFVLLHFHGCLVKLEPEQSVQSSRTLLIKLMKVTPPKNDSSSKKVVYLSTLCTTIGILMSSNYTILQVDASI